MPYVTDTHSLIWYLSGDPKLSGRAKAIFREVDKAEDSVYIPCIVFFEILYLTEKHRLSINLNNLFVAVESSKNYCVEPLCIPIIEKSREISRERISDPWDRLIAATSLHLGFPLITRDESLRKIGLEVVW